MTYKVPKKHILSNLINSIPYAIFWKDVRSVFVGCNVQFANQFGFKNTFDVIGKKDSDLGFSSDFIEKYIKDDLDVLNGFSKLNYEEEQMQRDGSIKTLLVSKLPIYNENKKIIGVLGIYTDITNIKKQEKYLIEAKRLAEAGSKSKSEFVANMSHDLRTPITGILGMVQDMLNTANQAESSWAARKNSSDNLLKNMIKTVQKDSGHLMGATNELLQLCNEILEVMRLESGEMESNYESFDIRNLIFHNIELLRPVARHKQLKLLYHVDDSVPCYFNGLRVYLDRILLNLISNALKFTKEGEVSVGVMLIDSTKFSIGVGEKINLKILVKDTGVGIPDDKFDTIFENFSRLNPSYEGLYKGAGLGLYTVKRYIIAMGGEIIVSSELNKGSCFTVIVPLTVSDHADLERKSICFQKTDEELDNDKKTLDMNGAVISHDEVASILIVEDNALAAIAVNLSLKPFNCCVEIAENGFRAIELAENKRYDLILMDIGLPDINGIEVTKKIRAFADIEKSQVPIVALTGHANNPEMRQKALDSGMQEVLSKPAQFLDLKSVLQKHVFNIKPEEKLITQTSIEDEASLDVIDWEACVCLYDGDIDFTRKMLSMLSDDLKNTQTVLAAGYANRDSNALRAELHRARGGVCYLKVPQLEQALKNFHQAVKSEPQSQKELETTYAVLQQAINTFWEVWEELKVKNEFSETSKK